MNRVIHGAIRRDLGRFVDALDNFMPRDQRRADQLGRAWRQFDDQLHHHHVGEHSTAWPALVAVGVTPELLATMDAEHEVMAAALAQARGAFEALEREPTATHAANARTAVHELQRVTVEHLDHEESELEPVYLEHKESPALLAMEKEFAKVPPSRGGRFFAWITDGASPGELAAVRANVPAPVLAIVGGVFGYGYRRNIATVWTG